MLQIDLDRRGRVDRDIEHRAHGGQQLGRKQHFGAAHPHLARGIALQLPGSGGRGRALGLAVHPLDIKSAGIQRLARRQARAMVWLISRSAAGCTVSCVGTPQCWTMELPTSGKAPSVTTKLPVSAL
jgi:hypothetical protein